MTYPGAQPDPQQPYQPLPSYPTEGYAVPEVAPGGDPLVSPDYNGWWQRTMAIVKTSWKELLTLQLIGAVFVLILRGPTAVYQQITTNDFSNAAKTGGNTPSLGPLFAGVGLSFLGTVLSLLVAALVTLATVLVVVTAATGGRASVGEALSRGLGRLFPLIGWQLLASLIIIAGVCACILPAIYFAAVFTVLAPVVAFERTNAISRCFRLFHGNLGTSVSRVATLFGIYIGAGIIGGVIGAIFTVAMHPTTAPTGTVVVASLITTAVAAIIGAAAGILTGPLTVTAYADMRSKLEPVSTPILVQEVDAA